MNRKWKPTLQKRSSDQGFALPVAVGMGLIMILVGTTMILRSQDDQVTASAQKATARGLGAAETGITRYQTLINNNRLIALYNRTGTVSWTNASSIPGFTTCTSSPTLVSDDAMTDWQDVDPPNSDTGYAGDPIKGQYRLVDYTYGPTQGVAPGTGQLTVEGRVNQSGSSSTATQDVGTATTRLQVNIPVQQGDLNSVPIPGAFVKNGGTGKNTIQGNVLLSDCSASVGDVKIAKDPATEQPYLDPNTGKPYKAQHTSATFPSLPTSPTIITSPNNQNLGTLSSKSTLTLPRSGDKATDSNGAVDPNGVYRYSVTSIDDGNIIITPGKKVTFYLAGSISKKGGDIQHTCVGFTSEDSNNNGVLDTGEDKNSDGILDTTCKPTNFQIFGFAPVGTPTPEICLNGNDFLEAFIFAPNYQAGVAGGGGGKGGFKGSIWVNDWSNSEGCGSETSNVVVVQTATWTDLGLIPRMPPQIASTSSWQRQEAN